MFFRGRLNRTSFLIDTLFIALVYFYWQNVEIDLKIRVFGQVFAYVDFIFLFFITLLLGSFFVRRLHDLGRPGKTYLPFLGIAIATTFWPLLAQFFSVDGVGKNSFLQGLNIFVFITHFGLWVFLLTKKGNDRPNMYG